MSAFVAVLFIAIPILVVLLVGFILCHCTTRTQSTKNDVIMEVRRGEIIQGKIEILSEPDPSHVVSVKNPAENIGTIQNSPEVVNFPMTHCAYSSKISCLSGYIVVWPLAFHHISGGWVAWDFRWRQSSDVRSVAGTTINLLTGLSDLPRYSIS